MDTRSWTEAAVARRLLLLALGGGAWVLAAVMLVAPLAIDAAWRRYRARGGGTSTAAG